MPTSRAKKQSEVLILGGRSWVGYWLSNALTKYGFASLCTTATKILPDSKCVDGSRISYIQASRPKDYVELINKYRPDVVVNMLIGTDDIHFQSHVDSTLATQDVGSRYVYVSSALALDACDDGLLVESLGAKADSEYGKFKGRCENFLKKEAVLEWLVVRFSSIHGWSPWKKTRTEVFLSRIANGETVTVKKGVVQNRMSDRMLSESIASLIAREVTGVAHLGTSDCSDEVFFLKQLAIEFGLNADLVVPDGERNINLAVVPSKGLHPDGPKTELDTLVDLHLHDALEFFNR